MTILQMVREVLRDHIRSVDTICWGINLLFHEQIDIDDIELALAQLESQGQAERIVFGGNNVWWRRVIQ